MRLSNPPRADELGNWISKFVEEHTNNPEPKEIDLWSEATNAALFTVAFQIVMRLLVGLDKFTSSPEDLQYITNDIVIQTSKYASTWVNNRLDKIANMESEVKIHFDTESAIRARLIDYFNAAYDAIGTRGYDPETAQSHACFLILSEVIGELLKSGVELNPEQAAECVEEIFESCQSIALQVKEKLSKGRI